MNSKCKNLWPFGLMLLIVFHALCLKAADRIVADGGSGGAFSSIAAALTVAGAGDRILVYPKANGAAYTEELTISVPLQILCATEAERFKLNGSITIGALSGSNASITISGIYFLNGSISTSSNAATTGRARVNILGCKLDNGNIFFDANNWDINIAADSLLSGRIVFRRGKLVGNFIASTAAANYQHTVVVTSESVNTSDTVFIIGNIIQTPVAPYYLAGIDWQSTTHFFYISNNYINIRNTQGYGGGIQIENSRASLGGKNSIINNTIYAPSYIWMSIYSYNPGAANTTNRDIYNNLVLAGYSSSYAAVHFIGNVSQNNVSFNYCNAYLNIISTGTVNDGTNIATSNAMTGFNINTAQLAPTADAINAGYADSTFCDLDLSRNDIGAYGGSYSLAQFHPMNLSNARLTFMTSPRRILVGQTVNVRAEGFDR